MAEQYEQKPSVPTYESPPQPFQPGQQAGDGGGLNPADETDLWQGRASWKHFGIAVLAWALYAILVIIAGFMLRGQPDNLHSWLGGLMALLICVPGLVIAWKVFYSVFSVRYRLTTQRLFIERGLLARTIDQTELIRVDDVRVHKSILDRMFGVGTVEVRSTDNTNPELRIEGIKAPDDIAEHIRHHMRVLRKKSLYMESL